MEIMYTDLKQLIKTLRTENDGNNDFKGQQHSQECKIKSV